MLVSIPVSFSAPSGCGSIGRLADKLFVWGWFDDVQVRKDVFLNRSRIVQLFRLCMQGMS
jgi:hypothetical protein